MIVVSNPDGKNPNQCHQYLLDNGIIPASFEHNRQYVPGPVEQILTEATEFYITFNPQDETATTILVNQFMAL